MKKVKIITRRGATQWHQAPKNGGRDQTHPASLEEHAVVRKAMRDRRSARRAAARR